MTIEEQQRRLAAIVERLEKDALYAARIGMAAVAEGFAKDAAAVRLAMERAGEAVAERESVLCYVEGPWAYFTTQDLDKQWGDDWNDAPYDCNAGEPYRSRNNLTNEGWKIVKVAFDADLEAPCDRAFNCALSVEDINAGKTPWLETPTYAKEQVRIMAGTPLPQFVALVQATGGEVYAVSPMGRAAAQGKGE